MPSECLHAHYIQPALAGTISPVMPVQYVIDKRHGLVITSAWDLVAFSEYRAHQEQLMADPDFDSTFNHLLDSTMVTAINLSISEIKTITSRSVFSSTSKRAIIAPNPAYFGVARMAEAYHSMTKSPSQVRVFHDLSSALKWLDLESDIQLPTLGEITR